MTITTSYEVNTVPEITQEGSSYKVRHGHPSLATIENRLADMKISEVVSLIAKIKGDIHAFETESEAPKSINVTAIEEDNRFLVLLNKKFDELQNSRVMPAHRDPIIREIPSPYHIPHDLVYVTTEDV